MTWARFCWLILLLAGLGIARADEILLEDISSASYPTLSALSEAVMPPADRVTLAQRFLGIGDLPPAPPSAPVYALGDRRDFTLLDDLNDQQRVVTAELMAMGQHVLVWVEPGQWVQRVAAAAFARHFYELIYPDSRLLWGAEASPGVDGDPRIYTLFASGLDPGLAAYFSSQHSYPQAVAPGSSEHDMLIFSLRATGPNLGDDKVLSVAAHELQHMIRHNVDPNEAAWMDEGFSMFTEQYLGYDNPLWLLSTFTDQPLTQLNAWPDVRNMLPHYGASMAFVTYFYERYGLGGLQALSAQPLDGLAGVDAVLAALGQPDVSQFFADWTLTNALAGGQPPYAYTLLNGPAAVTPPAQVITSLPASLSQPLPQYSAWVLELPLVTEPVRVDVGAAPQVRLIGTDAASGSHFWYSNKGDQSHSVLEQRFDLSAVSSAGLHYRVWYDIETDWDYVYLTASRDAGQSWDVLAAPAMRRDNPHGLAYGPGYTGRSDGWQDQLVVLDAYAGGDVLLRFEMITDDSTTQPGLALDDISIPEIDYASDFESDDGGWLATGWLRTDNRLPQQVWVQAAILRDDGWHFERWLAPQQSTRTLSGLSTAQRALLVIAPFAPLTVEPADIRLHISEE